MSFQSILGMTYPATVKAAIHLAIVFFSFTNGRLTIGMFTQINVSYGEIAAATDMNLMISISLRVFVNIVAHNIEGLIDTFILGNAA